MCGLGEHAAGAVSGEIDRGTMELLMSQPVPRNRLILAHLIVDAAVLPLALAFFLGTQFGLAVVGDFARPSTARFGTSNGPTALPSRFLFREP